LHHNYTAFTNRHECKLFKVDRTFPRVPLTSKVPTINPCAECRAVRHTEGEKIDIIKNGERIGTRTYGELFERSPLYDKLMEAKALDAEVRLQAMAAQGMYGGLSSLGVPEPEVERLKDELQNARKHIEFLLQKNAEVCLERDKYKADNKKQADLLGRMIGNYCLLKNIVEKGV